MQIHFKRPNEYRLEHVTLQDGTEFYRPMVLHKLFACFYAWKTIYDADSICRLANHNDHLRLSKVAALRVIEQVKEYNLSKFGNGVKSISIQQAELTPYEASVERERIDRINQLSVHTADPTTDLDTPIDLTDAFAAFKEAAVKGCESAAVEEKQVEGKPKKSKILI